MAVAPPAPTGVRRQAAPALAPQRGTSSDRRRHVMRGESVARSRRRRLVAVHARRDHPHVEVLLKRRSTPILEETSKQGAAGWCGPTVQPYWVPNVQGSAAEPSHKMVGREAARHLPQRLRQLQPALARATQGDAAHRLAQPTWRPEKLQRANVPIDRVDGAVDVWAIFECL